MKKGEQFGEMIPVFSDEEKEEYGFSVHHQFRRMISLSPKSPRFPEALKFGSDYKFTPLEWRESEDKSGLEFFISKYEETSTYASPDGRGERFGSRSREWSIAIIPWE